MTKQKQWYNIYMKCIKESPSTTAKLGEVTHIGKIKSEGLAALTCGAIQDATSKNFKIYYE